MPTTITKSTSYAGVASKEYILPAIIGGTTFSTDGITRKLNVKGKFKLKKLSGSGFVQSGTTSFSAGGTIAISEKEFEAKPSKLNVEIPILALYDLWDVQDMKAGSNNDSVPPTLEDAMHQTFILKVNEDIENAAWTGNSLMAIGGFLADLAIGSGVSSTGNYFTGSTVPSSSNIITLMNAVYNRLPKAVKQKSRKDLVYFIAPREAGYLEQNVTTQYNNNTTNAYTLAHLGIEVRVCAGLPDGAIVLGERVNFVMVTDLESDFNEVTIIDMSKTTGDRAYRYTMNWKVDNGVGFPSEAIYYKTV